jgi:hypothetical protein|tara:strand:+ start:1152 stop:1769 length:618 start_codon:yes stop_codon:yes gene_type:complete
MALPSSGTITLNEIHIEAGGSTGSLATINDADIRALIGKADGAQMSFTEWYGASSSIVVTVTEGSNIFTTSAYYGFREEQNPDIGSVSPTSISFDGKTHPVRDAYRRVNRSGGTNDDSTSAFWFILYNASDGTVPADDWFASVEVQTTGAAVTLTPAEATIVTSGSGATGRKEWRFFSSDFTATELTNFSAQWDGSGTSTVTFTE